MEPWSNVCLQVEGMKRQIASRDAHHENGLQGTCVHTHTYMHACIETLSLLVYKLVSVCSLLEERKQESKIQIQ